MSFRVSNISSQKKMIKKILHYFSYLDFFSCLFKTLQIHNRSILPVMHYYVFIFLQLDLESVYFHLYSILQIIFAKVPEVFLTVLLILSHNMTKAENTSLNKTGGSV